VFGRNRLKPALRNYGFDKYSSSETHARNFTNT
jgi:hypothetical protein